MKHPVIYRYDPVLYPVKLWVVATSDLTIIKENFNHFPSGKSYKTKGADGLDAFVDTVTSAETREIGILVVFKPSRTYKAELMAHEATHVSDRLWRQIGERIPGSEANAYFVGWVVDCIEKALKNKSK